jgi:hypothetical protein
MKKSRFTEGRIARTSCNRVRHSSSVPRAVYTWPHTLDGLTLRQMASHNLIRWHSCTLDFTALTNRTGMRIRIRRFSWKRSL